MNLLNAPALLFALIAIPILLLYLLRLRRREQTVSSTLLWRQVLLDREANTLWQRLRRNLLLLLQLITLAFLVFALTRPYVDVPGGISGRHIVLLDASASMQATDVLPSRFEAARARVRDMIEQLGPGDALSIILVDRAPRALIAATDNKAELLNALDAAQPSLHAANWSAAIALAQATAGSESPFITVISDGAGPADGSPASPLSLLGDTVRFIPIGTSGDNLAITNLSLRRTLQGLAAFVRVENMGSQPREALVSLRVDGALADARTLVVPAGQSVAWTVNGLDPRASAIRATLQAGAGNALAIDDTAYAVNTARSIRRALLLSRGNLFLEQALVALPELEVTRAITPPVLSDASPLFATGRDFGFDLFILDNLSMTLPPEANALYVGAAAPFTVTGQFSNTGYVRTEAHPIMDAVDWRGVNIQSAALLDAPAWLRPLVQTQGGPALYAGRRNEASSAGLQTSGRVVVIPFDLRRSDLPLQIAFPVLIANVVEWLAPTQGASVPASIRPGEAVPLPPDSVVQLPDGSVVTVGERGFADTDQLGIYQVVVSGARAPIRSDFAVNFFNRAESNIAPNLQAMAGRTELAPAAGAETTISQREIWPWLATLALIVLLVEWWIYQRGLPTLNVKRAPRSPHHTE
ncbi:MAG: VWA domain-containing protein [Candidatus Roseilinea sp.]|uniref:VWA domain-containing protein n=1 Tax=Candidatus Roseilinea sp. TaxID=2838777 RepID=UPI0040499ADD